MIEKQREEVETFGYINRIIHHNGDYGFGSNYFFGAYDGI
jgi:hypothetical protein